MPTPRRRDLEFKLLIIGHRQGLINAVQKMNIPFSLWTDKKIKQKKTSSLSSAFPTVVAPFPEGPIKIKQTLKTLFPQGDFTHVLAGTEGAVYIASIARRVFKARTSQDTLILRCHDKYLMKQYLLPLGIPMTPFLLSRGRGKIEGPDGVMVGNGGSPKEVYQILGPKIVVKNRKMSGGRGMETIHSLAELKVAMEEVKKGQKIFEKFIEASEASVECFIQDGKILFENVTQYWCKSHVNLVPAHLDPSMIEKIKKLNREILTKLKVDRGMTHLEVYLHPKGLLFGEVALRPPGGYIMELLELAYGFNAWEAYVAMELDLDFSFPSPSLFPSRPQGTELPPRPQNFCAAHVLHPGEGKILAIEGVEKVRALSSVSTIEITKKVGQEVAHRDSIGQEIGHIIFQSPSPGLLIADLNKAQTLLKVDLDSVKGQ